MSDYTILTSDSDCLSSILVSLWCKCCTWSVVNVFYFFSGIMCPQRGAVFSYHHRHVTYPYGDNEREACNIFFVWEMLRPLLKGVPLYIVSNQVIYDPPLLCEFLREHAITRMLFTPSLLETIINTTPTEVLQDSFQTFR